MVNGGGNVGIGVTSPTAKLHVDGTVRFQSLGTGTQTTSLMTDASGNISSRTLNITNWDNAYSWGDHAAEGYLTSFSEVDPTWNGTADQTGTIGRAGNVGIGTTSPTTKLDVNGTVKAGSFAQNSDGIRITSPDGAAFATNTSAITGAIKIQLPQYRSSTMMRMTVKIYQYTTDKSYTIELGGYNYSAGNWLNTFADISTRLGDNLTVRFGHDGTYNCIWIGETTSNWSYPQVFVTEFQGGFNNCNIDQWDDGWDVSFVTSFNTVETTANSAYTPSGTGTTNYLAKWITPTTLGIGSVYDNGKWV